jgi:Carboxypeptidase regulatory-like domain
MTALIIAFCLHALGVLQVPGVPSRDTPPRESSATGSCVLRGRVVDLQTGAPLPGALVAVWNPDRREKPVATTTDAEGRWEIKGLRAGGYRPTASKPGYVTSVQRLPRRVSLTALRSDVSVELALIRGGVISGRLTDETGGPAVGVEVTVLRYLPAGRRRRFHSVGQGRTTDDRGAFRIFDLVPGEYVLMATPRGGYFPRDTTSRKTMVRTFYPGTPNPDEAQHLTLGEAGEYSDITFAVLSMPAVRVSGRVVSTERIRESFGMLRPADHQEDLGGPIEGFMLEPDGSFTATDVVAGRYRLGVRAELVTGQTETAEMEIVVGDEDLSDLVVATRGPARIVARVVTEPEGAPLPEDMRFEAQPVGGNAPFGSGNRDSGRVKPDGTVEFELFHSPVKFIQAGPMPGWTVKYARWKGRVIGPEGLVAALGERLTGVEIVLHRVASQIAGTVAGIARPPAGSDADQEATAIVFREVAEDEEGFGIAAMVPIRDGAFLTGTLPAGDYQVVAIAEFDRSMYGEPERVALLRGQATNVTLGDNETRSVSLRLVTSY